MITATTLRAIRYDLCEACTMPRRDRHHEPGYRMERTPYDIPGHPFKEPGRCPVCGKMLEVAGVLATTDGKVHDVCVMGTFR